jgi:hypothetical protein
MFAGVDWAESSHVVCVIDGEGEVVERVTVAHDKAGIARLIVLLAGHAGGGHGDRAW